jgi:Xaa-Pro aminopeptidase
MRSKLNNKHNLKNYILKDENAVYHKCNYSCDNQLFVSLDGEYFFITDTRYELDAKLNIKNSKIVISKDLIKTARKILKKSKIKKLYFDPFDLDVATFFELSKNLNISFIEKPYFSKKSRIIKTNLEIKFIKKAVQIGKKAFKKFKTIIESDCGLKRDEYYFNFVAKNFLSNNDKYDLSFNPITAIDKNSAKPHATSTKTKYNKNSLLLFDGGVKYKRYCSDRTRTYINKKDKFQQKIYDIVLKAHNEAISKAKVGMKASDIDKIARNVIQKYGYEKYFIHALGHGVGLDIHEYPIISQKSNTIIEENMVFTIEPGIYLPNKFGIRIEDTIVMKNNQATIL